MFLQVMRIPFCDTLIETFFPLLLHKPPQPIQVLQTLLIYGKVSSNGESSRCAKTPSGASLSSGMLHVYFQTCRNARVH